MTLHEKSIVVKHMTYLENKQRVKTIKEHLEKVLLGERFNDTLEISLLLVAGEEVPREELAAALPEHCQRNVSWMKTEF